MSFTLLCQLHLWQGLKKNVFFKHYHMTYNREENIQAKEVFVSPEIYRLGVHCQAVQILTW